MSENQPSEKKQHQRGNAGKGKKLYQKPGFRYERVFETLALSCGKVTSSGLPNCQNVRKSS